MVAERLTAVTVCSTKVDGVAVMLLIATPADAMAKFRVVVALALTVADLVWVVYPAAVLVTL